MTSFRLALPHRLVAALGAVVLVLLVAPVAAAQERLEGRVVRNGSGVAGVPVTLHRVTNGASGPAGETTTGAGGAFSLPLPPPPPRRDSTDFVVFFATVEADGVRYFGPPLHTTDAPADYRIAVYDTTSAAGAVDSVRVARRDVALVPSDGGGWEVGEIVRFHNTSGRTIVTAGGKPVVGFSLPDSVAAFEVGDGEVTSQEVARVGKRVLLNSPFPPGVREVFVRYRIPDDASEFRVAPDRATDTLHFFVRQPSPAITADGLTGPRSFRAENEEFVQYSAFGVKPGAALGVEWAVPLSSPVDPRIAAMVAAALVLAVGVWAALRRGGPAPPSGGAPAERAPEGVGAAAG